jgi:hypothetical protein
VSSPGELCGVWMLSKYIIRDETHRVIEVPLGPNPRGILVYTASGHMSVHAMSGERQLGHTRRPVESPPQIKIAAFDSYFGYSGRYSVERDEVTHHVEVSAYPDWAGRELRRLVELRGRTLVLTGAEPGAARIPVLTWMRAA